MTKKAPPKKTAPCWLQFSPDSPLLVGIGDKGDTSEMYNDNQGTKHLGKGSRRLKSTIGLIFPCLGVICPHAYSFTLIEDIAYSPTRCLHTSRLP